MQLVFIDMQRALKNMYWEKMIWALFLPSFLRPVVLNIYIRKPEIPVVLVNQMFRAIPIGKLQRI